MTRLPRIRACRFSSAMPGSVPPKWGRSRFSYADHHLGDGELDHRATEVGGDRPGVVLGRGARVRGGHDHAADPLGAEGVRCDQRDQRGVDAAREAEDRMIEAVLGRIVAESHDQRRIDLVGIAHRLADPCRSGAGAGAVRRSARRRGGRGRRPAATSVEIEVAEQQLLLELGGPGDRRAVGADDDAVSRRRRARPGPRPDCTARSECCSRALARRRSPPARNPSCGGRARRMR